MKDKVKVHTRFVIDWLVKFCKFSEVDNPEVRTIWVYNHYYPIFNKREIASAFVKLEELGIVEKVKKGRYVVYCSKLREFYEKYASKNGSIYWR